MPLSSWWDINSPNSRTQPCVYTKNDGQWFIDQIAIRIQNESLLYTSVWWTDMENTLRAMSEDKRVAEWATFLFNEMKWDPTPLLKSLYENRESRYNNGHYFGYQNMDIYDYSQHHLWHMIFQAMVSSEYVYKLDQQDPLWRNTWLHMSHIAVQYKGNIVPATDLVGLKLLQHHGIDQFPYVLDNMLYTIKGKTLESDVYRLMKRSDFNPCALLKFPGFLNTLVSWHNVCNGGWKHLEGSRFLDGSHLYQDRVGYLLKNHFYSAWSYLDTCKIMEIEMFKRSALLQHYVSNVNTRNFELPQMDI